MFVFTKDGLENINPLKHLNDNSFLIKEPAISKEDLKPVSKVTDYLIVFNPDNLDSMAAAALFINSLDYTEHVVMQPIQTLDSISGLRKFQKAVFFGVEIPDEEMKTMANETETMVFSYNGGRYEWLKDTKAGKAIYPKATIIESCQEWYGHEQYLIDNSITNIVWQYLDSIEKPSNLEYIRTRLRDIGRYTNFYMSPNGEKQGLSKLIELFNLKQALEKAFYKEYPKALIKAIKVTDDPDDYEVYLKKVRSYTVRRKMTATFRVNANKKNEPTSYYSIDYIACPEHMSRDVMRVIYPSQKIAITFEQVLQYKVWRILAETKAKALSIAEDFEPINYWFEGETLVLISTK